MNIFWLDREMKSCAQAHSDMHVRKMIVEYAQMLCTAQHYAFIKTKFHPVTSLKIQGLEYLVNNTFNIIVPSYYLNIYKPTHFNHPCTKWVREGRQNYSILFNLLRELCKEYNFRFGKNHKTENLFFNLDAINLPNTFLTDFTACIPKKYRVTNNGINSENTITSCRNYYLSEKQGYYRQGKWIPATWTKRGPPSWWKIKSKIHQSYKPDFSVFKNIDIEF